MPTSSGSRNVPGFLHETISDNSGTWYHVVTPKQRLVETWTRNWLRTPGYNTHAGHPPHGLPWNQYGYARITIENWEGSTWQSYKNRGDPGYFRSESSGVIATMSDVADGFSALEQSSAIDEAVGKTLNRAQESIANWGENIATGKQTIDMIATNLSRIAKAMRAVRQGNIAKAARALGVSPPGKGFGRNQSKSLANGWLELQYGWLPLLQDIYETTKHFHAKSLKKAPILRYSGSVKRVKNKVVANRSGDDITTYYHESKFEAKVVLYFRVENEQLREFKQLGITNPLSLAWELLPFSFVVDWALPIGSYFANLDATLGLKYLKGGYTTAEERKLFATLSLAPDLVQTGDFRKGKSSTARHTFFACGRTAYLIPPTQKMPHFKDPASLKHLANAMALIRQNGGKR